MASIIGLDIGTNSIKAMLIEDSKILKQQSVAYSPDFLGNGFIEQDPEVWWIATKKAIKALLQGYGGSITALAASGQMHSSVFLDDGGHVIRPSILWNDTRTTKEVSQIIENVGNEKLLSLVYNKALEGFTLTKILWLKNNEPQNFAKLSKVIMPKDYINYMLTGVIATDISDASGTLALDIEKGCWNNELLQILDISSGIFPKVLESTAVVGNIKPNLVSELGLRETTKVIAGGADNSCAAIGNGVVALGQAVISIGTSGTVVAKLDTVPKNLTGDVHFFNYSYPQSYYAMGCMLCAGESLNWLKDILNVKDFEDFNSMAKLSNTGSNGIIFLPYLFGERCPVSDPNARGMFFGLSATTTKNDIVRSVMEGVAFNIRAMFELVQDFTTTDKIYITGGGAKSDIWGQIISDILNCPINVLNIEEGPAFGAALIAGVGAGVYKSFETITDSFLRVQKTIEPTKNDIYNKQYGIFKRLYYANKDLFKGV